MPGSDIPGACPPLVAYEPGFAARPASEIDALPEETALVRAIDDYRRLRRIVALCRELAAP